MEINNEVKIFSLPLTMKTKWKSVYERVFSSTEAHKERFFSMFWSTLFILTLCWTSVHCQNWVGNYTADTSCYMQACCCIGPDIQLTRPSADLIYRVSLYGQCYGQTSYSTQTTYPTGYTVSITIISFTLTITLSADSNSMIITSSASSFCNENAIRNVIIQITTTTTTAPTSSTSTVQAVQAAPAPVAQVLAAPSPPAQAASAPLAARALVAQVLAASPPAAQAVPVLHAPQALVAQVRVQAAQVVLA